MVKSILMLKNSLPKLPETAGVYIYYCGKKVIYVGKAKNLKNRILSYFNLHLEAKTENMIKSATSIKFIKVESELESLLLEAKLIKKYMPQYNIISKDDKHPLYIVITKEKFPRILCVRKPDSAFPRIAMHSILDSIYGPFPSTQNVHSVLKMIRRIFPYSDHKLGKRACIYSHIGLCDPCPNLVNGMQNAESRILTKKYMSNIKNIKLILNGRFQTLKKSLIKEMNNFSKNQEYENASEIKNKIESLEYITKPRLQPFEYLKNPNLFEENRGMELNEFKKLLDSKFRIPNSLHRIECYDIAHLHGVKATASMVVFIDGVSEKSEYRHFKIRQKNSQSDFDSMEEVAKRRSNHFESWGTPDLIIVDGSIGQINKFKKIIKNIPIVGIAKNPDRLVINAETKVKLQGSTLQLVGRIRDEAHRFARRYHHLLLSKNLLYSDK